MPVTLDTLFCAPQDVWDYLSVEGVELREDDHNLASGQIIQTTSGVTAGATSMPVAALPVALLRGAQLTFDGPGMAAPVTVSLTAAAAIGAVLLSVQQVVTVNGLQVGTVIANDIPASAQARDSGVNAVTGARLLVACRRGTSRIKLYCNGRYDDSELKLSGTVCDWATTIAAKFLCTRRAQGCPKSIMSEYEEILEELRMVQAGQLAIEDAGTRGADWPSMTGITVNPGYDVMRARVQPSISEQTPTAFGQYIDWNSAATLGW